MSNRRPLLAGNWKMNLSTPEGVELARELARRTADAPPEREIVAAPVFISIPAVVEALSRVEGNRVEVAAQNLHWEPSGAYTGEVSAAHLEEAGCSHVIIGHSERRRYFGETDETVNRKLGAALAAGLSPIVCFGETLDEREADETLKVVEKQLTGALKGFEPENLTPLVLAYEPVWAIGTGRTATDEQAQEVHRFTRDLLGKLLGDDGAERTRILYGGSVKPGNIAGLMDQPDIDGALVGGASLKADSFEQIVKY